MASLSPFRTQGQSAVRGDPGAGGRAGNRWRRDLLELSLGYGLIFLVLWTSPPWQRRLYLVAALFLAAASVRPGESRRGLGLTLEPVPASGLLLVASLALAGLSALVARHVGVLHAPGTLSGLVNRFSGYVLWSLVQQFLLQNFFLLRLRRLLPWRPAMAALGAAALFSAAHLPNPVLTIFTLIWGLVACALFLRYRNLWALGFAHAVLGISVAVCLPGAVTHNMHVGLGYFRWNRPYAHHHHAPQVAQRSVNDHTVSTSV